MDYEKLSREHYYYHINMSGNIKLKKPKRKKNVKNNSNNSNDNRRYNDLPF